MHPSVTDRIHAHLEVDVVGHEEQPGLRSLASAKAEDLGHVLTAEGRVGDQHVVLRDRAALHRLEAAATKKKRTY